MAFVNEYVSEDDIKKYSLEELFLEYHPAYKSVPDYYKPSWTIDRERDAYFMIMSHGREELSNRATCVFYIRGKLFDVELDAVIGTSMRYSEQPYRRVWELVSILSLGHGKDQREENICLLKEALFTYGAEGILHQVPNTIVEFSNF